MASILVVSERYWPEGGGAELATHLIVDVLRKEYDVIVVTGTRNPSKLQGVNYIYEPLLSKHEKPLLWLNTLRLLKTQRFQKILAVSDVVYIPRYAFPLIPLAKRLGKKVIIHLHDYIPISYTSVILAPYERHKDRIIRDDLALECIKGFKYCSAAHLFWWAPKAVSRWIMQADKIVCVSERQADIIIDQVPELKDKIVVTYNPIPPELLNTSLLNKEVEASPTLLYVGGDNYIKGFYILLQALNMLEHRGVKANIIFANKYSSKSLEILNKMKEKLKNVNLKIAGRVKYNELPKLHQKAQALIFPSIWEETFGYSVIEAVFLNTIPIFSKVGAMPELFAETPVITNMFTPGDAKQLVDKIENFLTLSESTIEKIASATKIKIRERLSSKNPEILIPEIMRG
jgi:glycosyltransferase involved in cell wall biosynthesis